MRYGKRNGILRKSKISRQSTTVATDRVYARNLIIQRKLAPSPKELLGESLPFGAETRHESVDSIFNATVFDFVTPFELPVVEYLQRLMQMKENQ